ncbi:MAG: hypothetical protein NZ653_02210 [Anaerolineae bacterium]|nr:hypothetical protein [Anaerolineae bacterium]
MKIFWGWFLIALGALLLGAVLFVGVRFWLSHRPFELYPKGDILTSFSPRDVNPSLALLSLAGYSDAQVLQRALEEGELETAYVTLVFSTSLKDQEKLGGWIHLADAFSTKGLRRKALLSYGQAYNIATLSPYLSDSERAEALIAIENGLKRLGEKEKALFVLRQVEALIAFSPYLKKAQRLALVQKLGKEVNLEEVPPESPQPALVIKDFALLPAQYYDPKDREIAVLSFASSPGEKKAQALREILKNEDHARLSLYREKISSEGALAQKAGWVLEKISWLTLKYRIAVRGFGVSLMPEWERNAGAIRRELSRSYEELFALYAEEAVSFPQPQETAKAWIEIATLKAYYVLNGFYADVPLEKIAVELKEAYSRGQPGSLQLVFLEDSRIFAYHSAE